MKFEENLIKFEVNLNLKKFDKIWNEYKPKENMMKLEVNINLKKIW
jgi:hypothetical protein